MRSNKVILVAAMSHYVCEGEVEFHVACEILKVSLSTLVITFTTCAICRQKLSMKF